VDTWLPGEGTPVYLPTMWIIPEAPREGIVLNLPSMRLCTSNQNKRPKQASTHGRWRATRSASAVKAGPRRSVRPRSAPRRATDLVPPPSVRAEHAEAGDPLPGVVPPGPENPLGRFALGLSLPGYLIHGTNKPAGVGMRVSHGCIRLFPEDIEALYDRVDLGTPVTIVDQPVLAGWRDGQLYLEVHPPLSEDARDLDAEAARVIAATLQDAGLDDAPIDTEAWPGSSRSGTACPFPS
jgi:L,D-transpeptidase ErfK/SrfK